MLKRILFAIAIVFAAAAPAFGQDDYPNKPVRFILPFPPGGGTDSLARILAEKMSESMGEQVIVDNRPGAAGNIASDSVAKSRPDGYTVLLGFSSALTVNPSLYEDLAFSIDEDFEPVVLIADAQYILVAHPSLGVKTVEELVAYAKEHPGELNFSSSGIGGPLHLSAELFMNRADIRMVHIPYGGGGPAAKAVIGGEVDVLFGSVAAVQEQVESGNLVALATTGLKRSSAMPDLATLDELGYEGFNVTSWYSLLVPAGTPQEAKDTLREEVVKALENPDVKEQLANRGLTPIGGNAEALAKLIDEETKVWAEVIERADIKPGE